MGRGRRALREKSQNKVQRPWPVHPTRAPRQSDGMARPSNPAGVQQESSMRSAPETDREGRPRQDVPAGPPAWPRNWSHWCAGCQGSWLRGEGKARHRLGHCRWPLNRQPNFLSSCTALPARPPLPGAGGRLFFHSRLAARVPSCFFPLLPWSLKTSLKTPPKTPPAPRPTGLKFPALMQKKAQGSPWTAAPAALGGPTLQAYAPLRLEPLVGTTAGPR